ncbi:MAG: NAD(P)H-hydrate dehydratase [Lachnospiraceae bacterium]
MTVASREQPSGRLRPSSGFPEAGSCALSGDRVCRADVSSGYRHHKRRLQGAVSWVHRLRTVGFFSASHKESFRKQRNLRKSLSHGGQPEYGGAAYLSGKAAAITGTGLVRVVTEGCNREILQTLFPEAVLTTEVLSKKRW